ncbi:LPXTG cell wall anchor domain-containing protein [Jiangella muralis]|uniref:LPXTG cell wall anchor domain-containing protein n=1 Tax=Jiangella muralis TaxID=702383 RepID=UPI0014706DFB|nr:LPXTG cell wall anchor domain-containing protein [Jiangella muralis]
MAGLALLMGATAPAWAEDGATVEATLEAKDAADCAAYVDSGNWCDPASDENYSCGDVPEADIPVQLVDVGVDPFGLDGDENGWGCGDAPTEEPPVEEPPAEEPVDEAPADEPGACAHYADSAAWCSDAHGDYNCPDIDDAYKPVELFDAELDPFHLDRDSDALGCEVGEDDSGSGAPGNGGAAGAGSDAGTGDGGSVGEALPNTGSGDLGPFWLAALAFLAAGALLVIRRTAAQR